MTASTRSVAIVFLGSHAQVWIIKDIYPRLKRRVCFCGFAYHGQLRSGMSDQGQQRIQPLPFGQIRCASEV